MIAIAIYILGGFIYAGLCGPAIEQRGYPPIDPAWTAVTYLWLSPILLVEFLDPRPLGERLKPLLVYCVGTAFFDAASVLYVVPKQFDFMGSVMMTLFVFGPLHLLVGYLTAFAIDSVWQACSNAAAASPRMANVARWLTSSAVLVLTVAFPFLFREQTFAAAARDGRIQAERDWNARKSQLYAPRHADSEFVEHEFDPATGLEYRFKPILSPFAIAYNERTAELLLEHGDPEWTMKPYLVPEDELLSLLNSDELREIHSFPYRVNDNIQLLRNAVRPGDDTMVPGSLTVVTSADGTIQIGRGDPVYVGQLDAYPPVFFIRIGHKWLGVFHESGKLLSTVSQY